MRETIRYRSSSKGGVTGPLDTYANNYVSYRLWKYFKVRIKFKIIIKIYLSNIADKTCQIPVRPTRNLMNIAQMAYKNIFVFFSKITIMRLSAAHLRASLNLSSTSTAVFSETRICWIACQFQYRPAHSTHVLDSDYRLLCHVPGNVLFQSDDSAALHVSVQHSASSSVRRVRIVS